VPAAGRGDVAGPVALLAPEVELQAGTAVIRGAEEAATRAIAGARADAKAQLAQIVPSWVA
jgi:hypothetical protein